MVGFCTPLCILLSIALREQGKKTTPDHVSTSYVSHYTQVKNHPYLDLMIVKRPKHFSLQKHNCVSESDMMRHKSVNGSGGLCTDNEWIMLSVLRWSQEANHNLHGHRKWKIIIIIIITKKAQVRIWRFVVLIRLGVWKLDAEVVVVLCCIANSPMNKTCLCFLQRWV